MAKIKKKMFTEALMSILKGRKIDHFNVDRPAEEVEDYHFPGATECRPGDKIIITIHTKPK